MSSEAEAGLKIKTEGTAEAVGGLDQIDAALGRVEKKATSASVRLKAMRKLWDDPVGATGGFSQGERVLTSIGKAAADIAGSQIRSVADAVTAPAKTSYAGAISVANAYRDSAQRVASSTGQSYQAINQQVMNASTRLALMPVTVQSYGRGVRALTGDWSQAMDGMDGYRARALATDRTMEEMIPTAAHLAQTFGVKSTADVNRFFGAIDTQAKLANVSATVLERTFMGFSGQFSRMTSAGPAAIGALQAAMMSGAPTAEMGQDRIGAATGVITNHRRYLERRARSMGVLGKEQHFYDEQGRSSGADMFNMLEVYQKDLRRHYGTKDKRELMGRMEESGHMQAQDAAGLLGLDIPAIRKKAEAATGKKGDAALNEWMESDTGKREAANAQKVRRDVGLGDTLLPGQDAAVAHGGGVQGIALSAAGQAFEKATGVFWDAVNIFAGKGGGGGSGGVVASTGGAAVGSVAPKLARLGPWGLLAAGALVAGIGTAYAVGEHEKEQKEEDEEAQEANRSGFKDVKAYRAHKTRVRGIAPQGPVATVTGQGFDLDHPVNLGPASGSTGADIQANADAIGASVAKHLDGKTIRTQSVTPAAPPAGQGQPE